MHEARAVAAEDPGTAPASLTVVSPGLSLEGRGAVVTGASRGIGLATAMALAAAGASLMLTSRKDSALQSAVERVRSVSSGGDVAHFAGNAGDPDTAERCIAAAVESFGSVDILVNNAATNPYLGPLSQIDSSAAEKTFQVNLLAPIRWTQVALEAGLGKRDGAAIVNVASIGGMRSERNLGFYNATKAALIHLTTQLAYELGPRIRVNCVAPGLVKTDMARALWEPDEHALAEGLPLRRLGVPDDIASAIAFLVSDRAAWITGQTLVVDGGALVLPSMRH